MGGHGSYISISVHLGRLVACELDYKVWHVSYYSHLFVFFVEILYIDFDRHPAVAKWNLTDLKTATLGNGS